MEKLLFLLLLGDNIHHTPTRWHVCSHCCLIPLSSDLRYCLSSLCRTEADGEKLWLPDASVYTEKKRWKKANLDERTRGQITMLGHPENVLTPEALLKVRRFLHAVVDVFIQGHSKRFLSDSVHWPRQPMHSQSVHTTPNRTLLTELSWNFFLHEPGFLCG